jgi:ABC-type bacteriocin/lantibiotic exporter with double-glycine peptidase domain
VGERGARLSGGQLQRIAIARALLKDAPLLVLDEATSHLDNNTEAAVLAVLQEVKDERAVLLISHSDAPLEYADAIFTVEHGRVVGSPVGSLAA